MKTESKNQSVDRSLCRQCKYYYVTWDPQYPHGCRGFDMKSKKHPALIVQESSGQRCLMFEPKVKSSNLKKR